jgi:hypothetical protein
MVQQQLRDHAQAILLLPSLTHHKMLIDCISCLRCLLPQVVQARANWGVLGCLASFKYTFAPVMKVRRLEHGR